MPPTPDPIEDGLDSLPPPPPVFHVEQALLGALLLEPHRVAGLTGIAVEAFSSAAHAALFAAIRSLPAPEPAEHAKTTTWLNRVLTAAGEQTRGLTTTYLHHLIQCCPEPRHARAYSRIIEAEHSRRLLRGAAHRLIQTTLDTSLPHRVATTLAEAGALTTVVDDIATRFPTRSGPLSRTPASTPVAAHDEEASEEERLLLATATARPGSAERMRWLIPGDFLHPLHAGLWQCLIALTRRGTPIDPVTVLWEAQHHGLVATGTAEPRELLGFLSEPDGCDPEYWGEQILQRSLLTTAHRTGRRIETLTGDPATTTYQLVVGARRALADLSAVRVRWHHATTSPPANAPARNRISAPPRAGPPPTTAPPAVRTPR
ncbi:DnaB-like helicase N-terminal domain-containing protein [Streptomyces niveus]